MNKFTWMLVAFLSGAFLPIQAALNTKIGKAGSNPIYAALISFLVGATALLIYIVVTRQTVSWAGLKTAPAYAWVGGLLGAFYVTAIVLLMPKLGPGLTFGLIVFGQMLLSVLMEHFNIMVAQQQSINLMKVLGVVLIVAGVVIIRKF